MAGLRAGERASRESAFLRRSGLRLCHQRIDQRRRKARRARSHPTTTPIFTLYGVLDGHEKVVRYDRLDDRSKPDHAEIRESCNVLVGPGEIDLVKPYEIHTEITVGERTVAVIIRSQKGGDFNQGRYVPEENRYYESLGPRQTPCEMLPKY